MIRILIASGYSSLREEWKQVLTERFPAIEFGETDDAQAALEAIRSKEWDVLLLDMSAPGSAGLDTLTAVRQAKPKLPVIVLCIRPVEQVAIRVLKLGAFAYIRWEHADGELVKGVEYALRGSRYITRCLATCQPLERDPPDAQQKLSDREYQVTRLLASGKTVKETASHLSLGVKTVSTYRTRILKKIGLSNNSQLMRYAVGNGLIDLC